MSPDSKLLILADHTDGDSIRIVEVTPDSPWHALLPQVQVASIHPHNGLPLDERPRPVVIEP